MTRIEEIKARLAEMRDGHPHLNRFDRDDVRWLLSLVEEAKDVLDRLLSESGCGCCSGADWPEAKDAARDWLSKVEEAT